MGKGKRVRILFHSVTFFKIWDDDSVKYSPIHALFRIVLVFYIVSVSSPVHSLEEEKDPSRSNRSRNQQNTSQFCHAQGECGEICASTWDGLKTCNGTVHC